MVQKDLKFKSERVFCIGNGVSRKNLNLEKLRPHGKIYGCNALYRTFIPDVLTAVDHGIMHEIYHSGYCGKYETWFRDWNKIPAELYDSMLFTGLSVGDKEDVKKYDMINQNVRTDEKYFVMHGANLKGLVQILHKNIGKKEKKIINHHSCCISWVKENDKSHDLKEIMTNEQGAAVDHGWSTGPTAAYIAIKKEIPKKVYMIGHDLYSNDNRVNNMYAGTKHYVIPEHSPTPCVNWIDQWKTLATWNNQIQFIKVNEFNDNRNQTNTAIGQWHGTPNIKYINFEQLDKELEI
jgi:hypothetical protein